jgi:branched-chain amino acid transport system permease protein
MTLLPGVSRRELVAFGLFVVAMIAAPFAANDYLLTVLILILYFAYAGQAWNVMMGFAGQLSLGHSLYVGLGAYTTAGLFVHYGTPPWIGLLVAVPVAMTAGAIIGFLAFRFRVADECFRRVRSRRLRSFRLGRLVERLVSSGGAIRQQ